MNAISSQNIRTPGYANSSNIGVDSEKFGVHYKQLGAGAPGGRPIRAADGLEVNNTQGMYRNA